MGNQYYNNYHCHTMETNPMMTDSIVSTKDYIKRALELGHKNIFTTEHGGSRDIYPTFGLCKKAGLNMIFSAEAYYVDDISYMRHKDIEYVNGLFMKCYKVWTNKHEVEIKFDVNDLFLFADKKKRDKAFSKIFSEYKEEREELSIMFYSLLDKIKKMDRKNYHIMLIAMTENGMEEINRILSIANLDGMYNGRPRVDKSMLLSLPKDDVIVTTACVAGRLFTDNYKDNFLLPMLNHFGKNFYLEVQDHISEIQIEWNKNILEIAKEHNIRIIHGCDSHYIYPEDAKDRDDFVKGKGIWFAEDDENTFVLDYPSRSDIVSRYINQGVLNKSQIEEALDSTLIFDNSDEIILNDDIKMPTIYPELSASQRYEKLYDIVKLELKKKLNNDVPKAKWGEYVKAIMFEMEIIKETSIPSVRTCDYFLINHKIIDRGVNVYDGILTRTGRGSRRIFPSKSLIRLHRNR